MMLYYNAIQEAIRLVRGRDTPLNSALAGGVAAWSYYGGFVGLPQFAVQAGCMGAMVAYCGRLAVDMCAPAWPVSKFVHMCAFPPLAPALRSCGCCL